MKIRTGFVSNSSSSSYIIRADIVAEKQLTTTKVLHAFLRVQQTELEEWKEGPEPLPMYEDVLQWIDDNRSSKENPILQFPSCNYDTFIWKRANGDIQINTCNNTDWTEATDLVFAEYYGDGSDSGTWEDMPMKEQVSEWDETYSYIQPDRDKILKVVPSTKYSELPELYKAPPPQCRFIALLEE